MNTINTSGVPLPPMQNIAGNIGKQTDVGSFKDFLIDSIGQVNEMQINADSAVESLATGGDVNPSEVMTAVQKADLTFRLMMQIRNKMMQAYQEIKDIRI